MSASTFFVKSLLAFSIIGGGLFLFITSEHSSSTITVESIESKTKNMTSVFNQIKWISTPKRDIWMMNQSHFGNKAHDSQWERLAIVIDKTKAIKSAKFYQLEAGPLEWSDSLVNKRTPYRASCFTCHNNGPRAIRPMYESTEAPLGLVEKVKLSMWNLRIKTYGRIHYDQSHDEEDKILKVPFRYSEKELNTELKVTACTKCHQEEGFFGRGALRFQQAGVIEFLVDSGQMPPKGFSLTKKDKKELRDFLRGF